MKLKFSLKYASLGQSFLLIIGFVAMVWMMGGVQSFTADINKQYIDSSKNIWSWDASTSTWKSPTATGISISTYTLENNIGANIHIPNTAQGASTTITPTGIYKSLGVREFTTTAENPTAKFLSTQAGGGYDALLKGVGWAAVAAGVAMMIGGFIFDDGSSGATALTAGVAAGAFTFGALDTLTRDGGALANSNWVGGDGFKNIGWSLAIGALVFYLMYEDEKQEIVTFNCYSWEAPTGGRYCDQCNNQLKTLGVPCSEYQCKSLGQACGLLNPNTDEAICEWIHPHDVEYAIIEMNSQTLSMNHIYTPDNTISPPDRGVFIQNRDHSQGKIKAYFPLSFGISTFDSRTGEPEATKCRVDFERKGSFDEMRFYLGGSSTYKFNHTQVMSLPGPSATREQNLTIMPDGKYDLYIRCVDANGNENPAAFVVKFEVEDGPDLTAPEIVSTSILNNAPISYNQTSVDLKVYVNEPANCRWSRLDQAYQDMPERMVCANQIINMNTQMVYECSTTLTGLESGKNNDFYFRCEDLAEQKNTMQQSRKFTLVGTRPLLMTSLSPSQDSVVKRASDPVEVEFKIETAAGYSNGASVCYYSLTGNQNDETQFFETNSYEHSQKIYLGAGEYTYYFRCVDLGGNAVINQTTFRVESDNEPPVVTRIYHEQSYLKIITDEEASCVYDTVSCTYNFEDGFSMTSTNEFDHYIDWDTNIEYFIKCRDKNGKEPLPNQCSVIVSPTRIRL